MDWDRYAYVRNNPVNYNDPTGHATQIPPITYEISNIYMPIYGLWNLVVGAACSVLCGVLPVHYENFNMANGAIVGDSPADIMDQGLTTFGTGVLASSLSSSAPLITSTNTVHTRGIPETEKSNFSRSEVKLKEYGEGTNLYRVHSEGRQRGHYWMENMPNSEIQWRIDQAVLPEWNTADQISILTVPERSSIEGWVGEAAYQNGFYIGGGNQVYLPYIPSDWIKTMPWNPE